MADAPLARLGRGGRGANITGATLVVEGLAELRRAIKRTEGDLPKIVRRELKDIGDVVRDKAVQNAPHRSGGLGGSIKVGVTQRTVSVYSTLVYSRVQDQGGRVGRHHATLLTRASVSQYMTRAVQSSASTVEQQVGDLLDAIQRDFRE